MECARETCKFLEPSARQKNQSLRVEDTTCDFVFYGCRQQIQDIFYNVIGNAIKFSPPASTVSISCHDEGDFHAVRVKDQGPGFTAEDFARLFKPGANLSAKPTGGEGSTGLGLYSVKRSVELFHGEIEIANNPEAGACVTIRFPRPQEADQTAQAVT
jgi:signal transduction histidine kinase